MFARPITLPRTPSPRNRMIPMIPDPILTWTHVNVTNSFARVDWVLTKSRTAASRWTKLIDNRVIGGSIMSICSFNATIHTVSAVTAATAGYEILLMRLGEQYLLLI